MILQLAEAASTGVDFAKIAAIGGPSSIGSLLLAWLVKSYIDLRKEKREDTKSDRQNESSIVATTDALAKLVREQMVDMGASYKALQLQMNDMKQRHSQEIEKLQERISALEVENEQLRRERFDRR